ncbi:MAG TPA: adenylyl-sulfate kinase [Kofleriaceae bacterium]|nr:adenylyl-sulfate kinase [Kofleriaceae bacterium]
MSASPGIVVWLTGLPQSGKSTLARRVQDRLAPRRACVLLDSDEVRAAIGAGGYGAGDRDAFYGLLASLAGLLARQGHAVLVAATAPRRGYRAAARAAAPRFVEVWVTTPLAACEARDTKGLYASARRGEAPELPGLGAAYEPPEAPEVVADGGLDDGAAQAIAQAIEQAAER